MIERHQRETDALPKLQTDALLEGHARRQVMELIGLAKLLEEQRDAAVVRENGRYKEVKKLEEVIVGLEARCNRAELVLMLINPIRAAMKHRPEANPLVNRSAWVDEYKELDARFHQNSATEAAKPPGLTFAQLAQVNIKRCRKWHDPEEWSAQMWGLAMTGEAGEFATAIVALLTVGAAGQVANALKKLRRHDDGISQITDREVLLRNVAMEIGDTAVYLDLLAQRLGLKFEDCIRDTFNRVSEREGFPERLP
jgi:NTP pyrophosphatase (non-canonical NTP hydrolase)